MKLLLAIAAVAFSTAAAADCVQGFWVSEKIDGGRIIVLQDGSAWRVSAYDRIDTAIWMPLDDIIVCDGGRLINTDTGDTIEAVRLR